MNGNQNRVAQLALLLLPVAILAPGWAFCDAGLGSLLLSLAVLWSRSWRQHFLRNHCQGKTEYRAHPPLLSPQCIMFMFYCSPNLFEFILFWWVSLCFSHQHFHTQIHLMSWSLMQWMIHEMSHHWCHITHRFRILKDWIGSNLMSVKHS